MIKGRLALSLSCIGEGNGNPLQCSCLENPRDGGAWWAAVYGVAQSQTRLKQLSSSKSLALSSLHQVIPHFYHTPICTLVSGPRRGNSHVHGNRFAMFTQT